MHFGLACEDITGARYNSNCDVVMAHSGISNCHFSLTFADPNRPIVKDLNSLLGTQVTYNGEGKGALRDFQ